ncbi:sensor histidine kinase [Planotetraspora kaengkrachanensis]|uniref:histidine kinase n=1 Tax=Planotetraspora kaengkrachanensis TaxID=575193 RepID=A0A8J3V7X8_9ACTN|nr:histidine kinase [Planotetraspora kaengkrachanensis]GIG81628.1 two-component sensor histidine kinase [Planotetraspora kaengkrachanensis]
MIAAGRVGRAIDGALAVCVVLATVGPLVLPDPKPWWIIGLGLLASVPVWWRRRAPMVVAVVVGAAMSVMVMWEKPFLPFGPLLAVYTIADLSPMWKRFAAIPAIVAAVGVSLVLPGEDDETFRLMGTAFVAAYALGTSARASRSRAAELAERARRQEQEHVAAAAEERTRIARDMHDIVTHSVGLMVVQAEAGPVVVRSDPGRAEAVFDAIANTGRSALTELRGVLAALRNPADGGQAWGRAGEALLQPRLANLPALSERSGLDVVSRTVGTSRPVAESVEAAVYRIVQEALTNVRKHAGTRAVRLSLTWGENLTVEVADDGRGPGDGGGYGLAGMRERAAACGGTLTAGAGRNGGFVVNAEFPLE